MLTQRMEARSTATVGKAPSADSPTYPALLMRIYRLPLSMALAPLGKGRKGYVADASAPAPRSSNRSPYASQTPKLQHSGASQLYRQQGHVQTRTDVGK